MRKINIRKEWSIFFSILTIQIFINYLMKGLVNNEILSKVVINNTILIIIISCMSYATVIKLKNNLLYREIMISIVGTAVILSILLIESNIKIGEYSYNIQGPIVGIAGLFESYFLLRTMTANKPLSIKVAISYCLIYILAGIAIIYFFIVKGEVLGGVEKLSYINVYINITSSIMYVITYLNIYRMKEKFIGDGYRYFHKYVGFKLCSGILMILMSIKADLLNVAIIRNIFYLMANYNLVRLFMGEYLHIFNEASYLEDISRQMIIELSQTKKELQESLCKYKNLIELLPEGIIIVQDSLINFVNDKVAQLFNLITVSSLEGRHILNIIHPSDHLKFLNFLQNNEENKRELIHFTLLDCNFAGEIRVINTDDTDRETYTIVIKDLTEQLKVVKMERMLLEKQEEDKIKNEVLANISHEFKTPVNVIYAAGQLLEENVLSGEWESVKKYTPVIRQNCNRLIRLINNFIDITRLNHGELHIKKVCMNIVPIVEEVTLSIISFAENKQISVIFDTEEEEIYCYVDVDLIERIMLNLLSNAIKYNKQGGSIEVMLTCNKEQVAISVKDTGVGIKESQIELLFNRFERGDKTLTRDNEGSGLGLNIVKNMIQCLDGIIEVKSIVGEGTDMTICLPKVNLEENVENVLANYHYDDTRLKKQVERELSDIYE